MSFSTSAHPQFCFVPHFFLSPHRRRRTRSALKKKANHPQLLQLLPPLRPLALRASRRSRPALPWVAAAEAPLQAGQVGLAGGSRACAPTLAAVAVGRRVWQGHLAAATAETAVGRRRRYQLGAGGSRTCAATATPGTTGTTGTTAAGTMGTAAAGTRMGGGVKRNGGLVGYTS